jgi:hypothetical protein
MTLFLKLKFPSAQANFGIKCADSTADVSNNVLFTANVRYPVLIDTEEDFFCRVLNTNERGKILKSVPVLK